MKNTTLELSTIKNVTSAAQRPLRHPQQPRNYIEKDFPVEHLTPIVNREVNSKKPIYQMHKWWARRLSSVFRMLIIASFCDIKESRKTIWWKYCHESSLEGKVILDAMMGGGTSVIEGLRLGGKVVGIDINPVAWFVTKKEVEPLDLSKVREAFKYLEQGVGKEIRAYYQTKCPKGHGAEVMYAIWHKKVDCAKCGNSIKILHDYIISEKERLVEKKPRKELVIFCPSCEEIFIKKHDVKTYVTCPNCKHQFAPRRGTSNSGQIVCDQCRHHESVIESAKRIGGPLGLRLFCIEYYCETCGRGYKKPDFTDVTRERQAKEDFFKLRTRLLYPKEAIPNSPKEHRPQNHGYRYFHQLFNERQLLSLSKLLGGILEVGDQNTREFLLLAFSACLETNNILCKYETKWQKTSALFGLPGYHPVERVAENNVWGTKYGRGTFVRCYEKIIRAKSRLSESNLENETLDVSDGGKYFTDLATSFEDLTMTKRNALLICQNSESLHILPDKSIDLIATDPPYFDNLNYSRLADFFYVWLRIGLMKYYDSFKPTTSYREREVVMNGSPEKTPAELVQSLTNIFKECERVLKPGRPMIFTFHHTQTWAWQALLKAITDGGFSITASHFVRSEGRTGFRKGGHISYDVCIVCRRSKEVAILHNPRLASSRSKKWVRRLFHSGNGLEDSDVQSIVMGNLLTYTPLFVMNGPEKNRRIQEVFMKCIDLKNRLEKKKGNGAHSVFGGSVQAKLTI